MPRSPPKPCSHPGCPQLINAGSYCAEHLRTIEKDRRQSWVYRLPTDRLPRCPVTVLCGPPGAGKTTHLKENASPGDLIIDLGPIAAALSGMCPYESPVDLLPFSLRAEEAVINELFRSTGPKHAWIVTTAKSAAVRREMERRLSANVIVFETPAVECVRRIRLDPSRQGLQISWQRKCREWWTAYQPRDGEQVIRPEGN